MRKHGQIDEELCNARNLAAELRFGCEAKASMRMTWCVVLFER